MLAQCQKFEILTLYANLGLFYKKIDRNSKNKKPIGVEFCFLRILRPVPSCLVKNCGLWDGSTKLNNEKELLRYSHWEILVKIAKCTNDFFIAKGTSIITLFYANQKKV